MNDTMRKGIALAFLTALISGFSVFINKFGVGLWEGPYVYTTAKNIVVAIFLSGLLFSIGGFSRLRTISLQKWTKLILIGIVGGAIPFLLFFKALTLVPATEAAFIHKTLFLWVALLAYPFLKERLSFVQLGALGVLFAGVFLFGAPSTWTLGAGSLMALTATALWAVENVIAKTVLKDTSALIVAWARMFIGSVALLLFLAVTGEIAGIVPSSPAQVGMTLLVGAALFLYVTTWYSALKYAPATVATSILVLAAPLTGILNSLYAGNGLPWNVTVPVLVMIVGVVLIINQFGFITNIFNSRRNRLPIQS